MPRCSATRASPSWPNWARRRLKEQINQRDIVPPLSGLLAAARPESPDVDGLIALGERIEGAALAGR